MDDYLRSIGFHRKKIAKDGSCLFRAVAEQVLHSQSLHTLVRAQCVDYLKKNRSSYEAFIEGDFEEYLCQLQDPQQWVGEVEINALASLYRRDFLIFQEPGKPPVNITGEKFKDKVQLCFLNRNHYDSVYSTSHIKNSAVCQSIVYELLYNGVFNMELRDLGQSQRTARLSDPLNDDRLAVCVSSDESDVEVDEPLWVDNDKNTSTRHSHRGRGRGRGQHLSERVRRSLNPTLFRNIEYDVWHKTKRAQQKLDYSIAAGMQYSVGDQCQVRLDGNGRSYNATVKEVPSNNNNLVVVHIEDLGRKTVPLWSLRPPSEEGSWSTVVKDKRNSNGHGDGEEHRKGRSQGKSLSLSSASVKPQPSMSPLGGHVQKQHSWPPPVTAKVAEGAPARPRRIGQSVSLVEATLFGVTKEVRQAKEEEQRNAALVEMQLRDEHSFPALGTGPQEEKGKRRRAEKRSSEKRSSEGRKTKSPVEDIGAVSPSGGQGPQTSTPKIPPTAAAVTPHPQSAAVTPPPSSDSTPDRQSSIRVPSPNSNTDTTPIRDAQAVKPNTSSPVAPAVPPSPPPPATAATSNSNSVFSFLTPILPTASSLPPTQLPFSSSPSLLPYKTSTAAPSSASPSLLPSSSAPTFIAPIAPSPVTAAVFLPPSSFHRDSLHHSTPSPSLPYSSSSPPAPPLAQAPAHDFLPNSGDLLTQCLTQKQVPVSGFQVQTQGELVNKRCQSPNIQVQSQMLQPQSHEEKQVQSSIQNQSPTPVPPSNIHSQTQSFSQSDTVQVLHGSSSISSIPQPFPCVTNSTTQTQCVQAQSVLTDSPETFSLPRPHRPYLLPSHLSSFPQTDSPQNMSQLHLDLLYPGFPRNQKGDVVLSPEYSYCKMGKDLPQDVNIMRFFFNLGVKAFSMHWCPPSVYLVPLQHAHSIEHSSAAHSTSPAPHCPRFNAPSCQQESLPFLNPAISAFSHQPPPIEAPYPRDLPMNQAAYLVTQYTPHRLSSAHPPSWQRQPMAPSTNAVSPLMYPSTPPYPPPGQEFPTESVHRSKGGKQQGNSATNGDATLTSVRAMTLPVGVPNIALEENLTRKGILVDTLPNNKPLQAVFTNSDGSIPMAPGPVPQQSYSVSMTSVSDDIHGFHQQHFNANKNYVTDATHTSPVNSPVSSVACSTEDDREGTQPFTMPYQNPRGHRRGPGGGRGRNRVYDGQRGLVFDRGRRSYRRRQGGEGFNQGQFGTSQHRGQGW
uniref:ubiquitinyl hydrolase 1 n=1 Tax=Cynoglossus semilaevis TaxID=244447 RepID=A0A3P8V0I7_CYNSE